METIAAFSSPRLWGRRWGTQLLRRVGWLRWMGGEIPVAAGLVIDPELFLVCEVFRIACAHMEY
jgi:hypothetical protein